MLGSLLSKYMIKQLSADKTPTVYATKCMNARQRRQHCEACVNACPTGALEYKNGITLAKDKCTNCNLCAAVCPSVTFVPLMETIESLYRTVHEHKTITVGCEKGNSNTLIQVACLCELPWEFFAYVALEKQLIVDVSWCSRCSNKKGMELIQKNLERVKQFLPEDVYEQQITLSDDEEYQFETEYTRREMFTYLKGQGKGLTAKAAPFLFPENEDPRVYRTLLVAKVKQQTETKQYGWNSIDVTKDCFGCGICETLCPQSAIQIRDEEEKRYFVHNFAKCTHCGICKTVCNQDAIRFSFCKRNGKRIVTACEIPLRNCSVCGYPIPESEDGLCTICRRKNKRG